MKNCLKCLNNRNCPLTIEADQCDDYEEGDVCDLWILRRPDQLPNQKQCFHWWDGKCHTMGCIFNDWDDYGDDD